MFSDPHIEHQPVESEPLQVQIGVDRLADQPLRLQLRLVETVLSRLREGFVAAPRTIEQLVESLPESRADTPLRRKIASALLELDAKQHAETIWECSKQDLVVSPAVEVKLIRWQSGAAVDTWRDRLRNLDSKPSGVMLAIEGLQQCGEPADAELIETWLHRSPSPQIGLAAAEALSRLRPKGNTSLASKISKTERPYSGLIAARLIAADPSENARDLMLALSEKQGSGPACLSLIEALQRHHIEEAVPIARRWLDHPDNTVRKRSIEIIGEVQPEDTVDLLFRALDDSNADLRELARTALVNRAAESKEHSDTIVTLLSESIEEQEGSWRVTEQALLALTSLKRREIIPRLLELLDHPRGEVNVTAAWALRILLSDKEKLPVIAERVRQWLGPTDAGYLSYTSHDAHRVTHLLEILGKFRFRPSVTMLRELVPKEAPHHPVIRATAIWALGKIWERGLASGSYSSPPPDDLIKQLTERMLDREREHAESLLVWYTAAISLGRIGGPSSLDDLRKHRRFAPSSALIGGAASWAIGQIKSRQSSAEPTNTPDPQGDSAGSERQSTPDPANTASSAQ